MGDASRQWLAVFSAGFLALTMTVWGLPVVADAGPARPHGPISSEVWEPGDVDTDPSGARAAEVDPPVPDPDRGVDTPAPRGPRVSPDTLGGDGDAPKSPLGHALTGAGVPVGVGQRGFLSYESFELHQRRGMQGLVAQVELAGGNLSLVEAGQVLPGRAGHDLVLQRTYNHQDDHAGAYGLGWTAVAEARPLTVSAGGDTIVLVDPTGARHVFDRDSGGDYAPRERLRATLSDDSGGWTLRWHDSGVQWRYAANGLLDEVVDRNDNAIVYHYDASGRLESITDAGGRVTTLDYNSAGLVTTVTDPAAREHRYSYSGDRLTRYTAPDGTRTDYAYDSADRLRRVDAGPWSATVFVYDSGDRVERVSRRLSGSSWTHWDFAYHSACPGPHGGDCTVVTDPEGNDTTSYTDATGRVTKVVDALGRERGSGYTANGDVDSHTTPSGAATAFAYDPANPDNITSITADGDSPGSLVWALDYNDVDNPYAPSQLTRPQGTTVDYDYDAAGRLSGVDAGASSWDYAYNADGTLGSATDPNGSTTTFSYDSLGRLRTITPPAPMGQTTLDYDSLGRVISVTDGAGRTTVVGHDILDRTTWLEYDDSSEVVFGYDTMARLRFVDDDTGVTLWDYHPLGWLAREELPDGREIAYSYRSDGAMTGYAAPEGSVAFGHDAAGQLCWLLDGSGPLSDTCASPPAGATVFEYDADGNRTDTVYPNGVTVEQEFDAAGRVSAITAEDGSQALVDLAYGYAAPGGGDTVLRQSVEDALAGTTTVYGYDAQDRLASATGGAADYAFAYDDAANLVERTVDGATTAFAFNAANQLVSDSDGTTYSYNGAGELTGTSAGLALAYNAKGQTTAVTAPGAPPQAYAYRGADQQRRAAAGTTVFTDATLGPLAQADGAGVQRFVREPSGRLAAVDDGGQAHFPVFDALGSTAALTGPGGALSAAYAYAPYGEAVAASGSVANPYRFAGAHGYHSDEGTGLVKAGFRYLQPGLGRWTQPDPLGTRVNAGFPGEAGAYAYAGGDPVNWVDPSGLAIDGWLEWGLATWAWTAASTLLCLAVGAATGGVGGVVCNIALTAVGFAVVPFPG